MPQQGPHNQKPGAASHGRLAAQLAFVVFVMVGLTFAAVPLYRIFCEQTGYGGTTQRASQAPAQVSDREMTVRFDANVAPGLPWSFRPEVNEIKLKIGENKLAFFRATNLSDKPTSGTATFNVTPEATGSYFSKIQCFCFQEQTLKPGESVEMPVSFFIDPSILNDKEANIFGEITLSYTFFPARPDVPPAKPGTGTEKKAGGAAKASLDLIKKGS